jgi:hypothetical protein
MKHFTLIVGHGYSLSNDTDSDSMTDYFPGIWGIPTQKRALEYAKKTLEEGHSITVTDYNNKNYHKVANKFIKALGLSQPLFDETLTA